MDGTLLESTTNDLSWMKKSVKQVLENDFEKIKTNSLTEEEILALAGIDGFRKFEEICEKLEIDPDKAWRLISHSRALEKLKLLETDNLRLCDGARELINFLENQGIKIGIVSNAPDDSVISVIEFFNLKKSVHYFTGISDKEEFLKHRKPDPFYVKLAKQELKREPFLFVGDSCADIEAAKKEDVDSVLITDSSERDCEPEYSVQSILEVKTCISKEKE